jgi:uncharacterized protein (TIGR04551 family)
MRWRLSICLLFALCRAAGAHAQASPAAPGSPAKPPAKAEAKTEGKTDKKAAPIPPSAAQPPKPAEASPAAPAEKAEPASEPAPAAQGAPSEATAEESAATSEAAASTVPPATTQSPAALSGPAAPPNEVPSPGEMENMLSQQLAASPQPNTDWTAPAPVLTLHGYYRVRGELMDTFWLGRRQLEDYKKDTSISSDFKAGQGNSDPFTRFRPIERRVLPSASQGVASRAPADLNCVGESTKGDGTCDVSTLRFANMRLRLSPQLNLSEDIRVKMSFDVFDNLVLGEPPGSYYGTGLGTSDVFPGTVNPSDGTTLGNTIKARRVWAEVRNRDLGELRFGRMPMSWGMGMYYNAGDRLDDDLSTDMDRVMGITKLAGLYFSASYDFTGEGFLDTTGTDNRPLDQSQLDDVGQFTFSIARRNTPEELSAAKERGELVLNGGVQLSLRNQESIYNPPAVDMMHPESAAKMSPLQRVNATTRTTDVWGLFRYRQLRIEAEFAWVNGGMDKLADRTALATTTAPTTGSYSINQLGYALQFELRLLNEKLGIYMDHGLATGDSDVDGLSSDTNYIAQGGTNRTISTFRFHPSYHVDLILWRNIMRQVTGAYYFRPGVSYDFIRSAFGQLAGARLDFIWSRASSFLQTWGNDPNLGIEIDASLYFRSEDGPDLDDGFHAMLQYGVLFPMRGLGYLHEDTNLSTAQTLRLVLGVVF